ncbi:hypothetical protein AB0G85_33810 [Streptomyces sioyaensis]|uniref:hypothetical protein n=1 Tax=Streptomyces sioyaensis TaxID=67364 RepID=UPI00340E2BEB
MRSLVPATAVSAAFDEPNLVLGVGLVPFLSLAERVGLPRLLADHLRLRNAGNSPTPTRMPRR